MINYYLCLGFACVNLMFSSVTSVNSQSLEERSADVSGEYFVQAFIGNCAQNAGYFERTIAASEAMGFNTLPDDLAPLVAPQDPRAEFKGYFVDQGEAAPYFLGVSRGNIDQEIFMTCTIANPYINSTEVVVALDSFLDLRQPDLDETGMGQRYRSWSTDNWGRGSSIELTDAGPMGYSGATLSMIAPQVYFPDQVRTESSATSLGSTESLILDQLTCKRGYSVIDVFVELEKHGYIDTSGMIGIDGISCFRIEGGIELNDLVFNTVCGQEIDTRTVEIFPDFLWKAPGCCARQQLSLGTSHSESVVIDWYKETFGFGPANARIRSNNTTLGDETELMCID